MELADAESIRELSWQLGYNLSAEESINRIQEVMTTKDHCAFVGIVESKIIGWIHAFKSVLLESNSFIEIGGLVVDENFRSKGIGKKLVEKVKGWSAEKGIPEIRVRSHVNRKDAHKFYLNNGFHEIKKQKVFQIHL